MDTELKKMGKVVKAHILLELLEDFITAAVCKDEGKLSDFVDEQYGNAYAALHEFLVKFIDLHIDK